MASVPQPRASNSAQKSSVKREVIPAAAASKPVQKSSAKREIIVISDDDDEDDEEEEEELVDEYGNNRTYYERYDGHYWEKQRNFGHNSAKARYTLKVCRFCKLEWKHYYNDKERIDDGPPSGECQKHPEPWTFQLRPQSPPLQRAEQVPMEEGGAVKFVMRQK
jgi:hypothetical protein